MLRLLTSLHLRCRAASPAALIYLGASALLLLAYRADVYGLIRSSYTALSHLGFFDFLHASARGDAATLLLMSLATQLLLVAAAGSRRALFYVTVGMLGLQAVFFRLAVNFFGVYEAPFSREFLGDGLILDFHGSFASFSAELSPATWTPIALALIAMAVLGELASRWRRTHVEIRQVSRPSAWALRSSGVMFILLGLLAVSPSHAAGPDALVLADLSTNPVVGVLAGATVGPIAATPAATPRAAAAPFNFRFDTTSRASKARHGALKGLTPGKKYNVILYFIESTSALYTGTELNGKPVTPIFDALSQHAAVFPRHYANYPLSANAMLNVLMSAYDQNSKKPIVQEHSHIGLTSIPEQLSAAGYRTYLASTGMLGYANQDKYLEVRKFDLIEDMPKLKTPQYTDWVGWGLDDRALIKPTLNFINQDRSKPFFVALFPVAPHHPYATPDKSFSLGPIDPALELHERIRRKYLDSLHYSDVVIGDLVNALEKAGAMEDTLLFIFADHGEAFYQHERNYNHPLFLYEENVHVPFIIYNKHLFPERVEYGGVSRHVDMLPTILDLVGLPPTAQQEGISLASPHDEQLALMHTSYKEDLTAIRDGQWKYIVRAPDGKEELYELTKDPKEKTNVAAANAEVATRYREIAARAREHREVYYQRALRDFPQREGPPVQASMDGGAGADGGSAAGIDAGTARPDGGTRPVAADAGR